jgi:hypothetical protein
MTKLKLKKTEIFYNYYFSLVNLKDFLDNVTFFEKLSAVKVIDVTVLEKLEAYLKELNSLLTLDESSYMKSIDYKTLKFIIEGKEVLVLNVRKSKIFDSTLDLFNDCKEFILADLTERMFNSSSEDESPLKES